MYMQKVIFETEWGIWAWKVVLFGEMSRARDIKIKNYRGEDCWERGG